MLYGQRHNMESNTEDSDTSFQGASGSITRRRQTSRGATLIPWVRGKPMAWDVTLPGTYAQSHLDSTSLHPGAAADNAAIATKTKYTGITNTHIFIPVAIETGGSLNAEATELIQDIGK